MLPWSQEGSWHWLVTWTLKLLWNERLLLKLLSWRVHLVRFQILASLLSASQISSPKKSWRRNWRQITHQPNADLMSQIISRRHQGKHSYWKTFLLPGPGLGHETWKAIRKSGVQWNKFHLWFCEFLAVNFYQKAGRFPSSETRMESPNHCRWFPAPLCQVIHKIQQRRSNDCYFKLCGLICGQDGLQLAKSLAWETPAMSFCSEWNSRYWLAISQLLITNKKTSTSVCLVHQYHNVCI